MKGKYLLDDANTKLSIIIIYRRGELSSIVRTWELQFAKPIKANVKSKSPPKVRSFVLPRFSAKFIKF